MRASLLALSVALALASASQALSAEKPNVLLICVDDLKPVLGCYGDKLVQSPNIDRLAARGTIFEGAYCNQAVCSPSRNALLTSLRPQTTGIYDLSTNFRKSTPDAVTLPQHFKQNGYRTEGLGKIFHVGHGNTEDPRSWSVPHFQAKTVAYVKKENQASTREGALFENKNPADLPRGSAWESANTPDSTYGDGKIADEAVARLKAAREKPAEPFFLAVGFLKPHLPFCAPQKYWDLYDRAAIPLAERRDPPAGAPTYAPQFGGELRNYKDIPAKGALDDDLQRTLVHGYYAATSYMDAQLGRVLDALDETGLASNTIVVLWGDHGWHLGDHGMWCKHTNYEQAARIPLIVVAPGMKPGLRTASLVESVDILPTLCDLASLPAPQGIDGQSFVPVLKDPAQASRTSAIHVYPRGERIGRAIRTARYRLVEWKKPGEAADKAELELYDYQQDPLETKNLAAENPAAVTELRAILSKHPEAKPQLRAESKKAEGEPKKADAKPTDRAALFARKDKNGDSKLSREEFLADQPDPEQAAKRWITFDADKDGALSKEEFVTQGKPAS